MGETGSGRGRSVTARRQVVDNHMDGVRESERDKQWEGREHQCSLTCSLTIIWMEQVAGEWGGVSLLAGKYWMEQVSAGGGRA